MRFGSDLKLEPQFLNNTAYTCAEGSTAGHYVELKTSPASLFMLTHVVDTDEVVRLMLVRSPSTW